MSPDREISSKELETCAKAASHKAVRVARAQKVAFTVQQGRSIVQHRADGSKKVVGTLTKAFVRPALKNYRVG